MESDALALSLRYGLTRREVWIGRGGGSYAMATPLGDVPGGCEASEL